MYGSHKLLDHCVSTFSDSQNPSLVENHFFSPTKANKLVAFEMRRNKSMTQVAMTSSLSFSRQNFPFFYFFR